MIVEGIISGFVANLLSEGFLTFLKSYNLEKETNDAFEEAMKKCKENKDACSRKSYELNTFVESLKINKTLNSSDKELLKLFYEELQNNIKLSKMLSEIQFERLRCECNKWQNKLRYYDQTFLNKQHFDVHYNKEIKIYNLFIEPNYSISDINGTDISTTKFLEDSIKILEQNHILFITGGYGSGKTIVTKHIQYSLLINNEKTIFIDASDFESLEKDKLFESIDSILNNAPKLYLFVDSFDSISNKLTYKKQIEKISKLLTYFNNLYLIVNFRTIEKKNEDDFQYDILDKLNDKCNIIRINSFNSDKIKEWINKYNILTDSEYQYIILKKSKELMNSFSIPLFLYVYASESKTCDEVADIYNAFGVFVDKTMKGKFETENHFLVENNINECDYCDFLTKISIEILKTKMNKAYTQNTHTIDLLNIDKIELLNINENMIFIEEEKVENIIEETFKKKIDKNNEAILNCYFFKKYGTFWGFKDNNIVYYLTAKKVFLELEKFHSEYKSCNINEKFMNLIKGISFPPNCYEFIFHFIEQKNKHSKQSIVETIRYLLREGEIFDIKKRKDVIVSYDILTIDIFFFVLFLRYNKNHLSQEINYILKRIAHYQSFAKIMDENISLITRRYFKNANINNAELRRINLKGYNFDYSNLDYVKFIQNKIERARFNNIHFNGTKYDLCYLQKSEFENISGTLCFKNSFVHNMDFRNIKKSTVIEFVGCKIQKVILTSEETTISNVSKIILINCIIEQLSINDSTFVLDIKGCIHKAKINLKNTKIIIDHNRFVEKKYFALCSKSSIVPSRG